MTVILAERKVIVDDKAQLDACHPDNILRSDNRSEKGELRYMAVIFVFSDSHGYSGNMLRVLSAGLPDLLLFLGDGELDLEPVRKRYPSLLIKTVRGNCDRYSSSPEKLNFNYEGIRIFMTHGHTLGVKEDPSAFQLRLAALEADAGIVLFGHTHVPMCDYSLAMHILNPGTVGDVLSPSYGVIEIDGSSVRCQIESSC